MTAKSEKTKTTRRKFLMTAGAAGAATIAMPQISRAQTADPAHAGLVGRQGRVQ